MQRRDFLIAGAGFGLLPACSGSDDAANAYRQSI
jgi:hypothetical protein